MAYIYKFELDESEIELFFDETPESALVALLGTLKRKENGGDWESIVRINARLRQTWAENSSALDSLKYAFQRCLAHYYAVHANDIEGLTTWLDETEFDEADLEVWPWPSEE